MAQHQKSKLASVEKAREDARKDAESKEEGATYHHGQLKEFKRYKPSPALHKTYEGHKNHVHAFKISPDYRYMVSGSADHTLRLWDAHSTRCLRVFEGHAKAVRDIDIIPGFNFADDNRLIVSGSSDKTLRMWDARSDSAKRVMKGHTDVVYGCSFSPDGEHVLSCSEDCTLRLWSTHEGHVMYVYKGHMSAVLSSTFSPGGRFILSCSDYGERHLKLWHSRMPVIRKPVSLGQRVFFTKSGLIKRIVFVEDPGEEFFKEPDSDDENEALQYLEDDEDDEATSSNTEGTPAGDSASAKTGDSKSKSSQDDKDDDEDEKKSNPDVLEKDGFSINVLSEGRFGKLTEAEAYYPGQQLIVTIRGVQPFQSFFVAAYLKSAQYDLFDEKSGGRVGMFDRASVMEQENAWLTCRENGLYRAATSDTRKNNRSFTNLRLKWTAPTEGVGDITFKVTLVPKNLDDPDLSRVYGLSYSCEETMPPRKKDKGSLGSSSTRSLAFKPKVKLDFDIAFNHSHLLDLFRDEEHELAEHYFAQNVYCTLPLGKLGVQSARGPKDVVQLLANKILGPNQVMQNVTPMPPSEKVIESRTIVTRDSLPPSQVDVNDVEEALRHEGHESSDDEKSEDNDYEELDERALEAEDDGATADPDGANPNEATEGNENSSVRSGASSLHVPVTPDEIANRKKFTRLAKDEVIMIRDMKKGELACAEEVRNIHIPGHKAEEMKAFALVNDELVQNGNFGGSDPHLQMPLPPNYPLNARPYDLAAQAARKGKKLMEATQRKKTRKDLDLGFKLKTKKGRELFAKEMVMYMEKLEKKKVEQRSLERRNGNPHLPGFENLAQMREDAMVPHYVERVGNWVKGDQPLENARSANVRATVNAGRRGEEGAELIAKLKKERELANQRLTEEKRNFEMERERKQRKSRISWGKSDLPDPDDLGEAPANKRKNPRTFRQTLSKFFGGSSKTEQAPTEEDVPLDTDSKTEEKKMASKKSMFSSFKSSKKGDTKEKVKESGASDDVDAFIDSVAAIAASEVASAAAGKVSSGAGKVAFGTSVPDIGQKEGTENVLDTPAATKGEGALDSKDTAENSFASALGMGELPLLRRHLVDGSRVQLRKNQEKELFLNGGTPLRRNDFAQLPGFEHAHHRHVDRKLVNFDNDLLIAEQNNGLIRTFLESSSRDYDGHSASINQVCFSHDERRVASCSSDKTIKIWDPLDGNIVSTLYGHSDEVMGVSFSHDSMFLVSCSLDNLVIVWNLTNGGILKKLFGHYDAVYRCCFTHNANSLMSSSCDMTIKSWNLTPHVPDAPMRPIMSEVTTTKCLMTWTPPPGYNEEITAYFIEYRIGHRGDFGNTISVSGQDRRRKIADLLPGTAYQFRIRAMNRMGKGPWSDPSPQIITEFGVPQKIERPEVEDIKPQDILITWWAPVPSVKGSAIQKFNIQLSGYGIEFGKGATWTETWNGCKQIYKDWEKEKARREALEKEGKDADEKAKRKGMKSGVQKMMMALRAKRDTREAKRSMRKSTKTASMLTSILSEVNAEVKEGEGQTKEKNRKTAEPVSGKTPVKLGWVEKMAERKRQFAIREIERTKRHLEEQKIRRKKREEVKKLKKQTKKKQVRLEKKYKKSEQLRLQQEEAEKKHKKLFAPMAFRAKGLSPGIMYRLRVSAVNNTGEGPFSEGCFSTFTLSTAPAKGEPPHKLSAELDSMLIEWSTPHDNGAAITAFMLRQCYDGVEHEFMRTVQRVVIDGLKPGKSYTFQIKSANSEGWSDWSNESEPLKTLTKEPDIPDRPTVIGKSPTSVTLRVRRPQENGEDIVSYVVRKREMSVKRKTAWGPSGAYPPHDIEKLEDWEDPKPPHAMIKVKFAYVTIENLNPASHYDFQVACRNGSGISAYSSSSYRTKTLPAQIPSKVASVWCTNVGPTSAVVNWEEPANNGARILGYSVQEYTREHDKQKEEDEHVENYSVGDTCKKRVDAMESSASYRFRVAARNSVGVGEYSEFCTRIESVKDDPARASGGGATNTGGAGVLSGLVKNGEDDSDESEGDEEKKEGAVTP